MIVVVNHLSLDGVMQGPGRPDEDTRDGFTHGGWAAERSDRELSDAMGEVMGSGFGWLFGRRTYDELLSHWNSVGGAMADGLNNGQKFVVTRDVAREMPWPNSTAVTLDDVSRLRDEHAGNLVIMGSGELIRALLPVGLIDELLLFVHPTVLGSGRRLFGPSGAPRAFGLKRCQPTKSGVVVASYEALR